MLRAVTYAGRGRNGSNSVILSVFNIPGALVTNGDRRLVVLNQIALSDVDSFRGQHTSHVFADQDIEQNLIILNGKGFENGGSCRIIPGFLCSTPSGPSSLRYDVQIRSGRICRTYDHRVEGPK